MQFISDILDSIPKPAWIGVAICSVIATFGVAVSTVLSNNVELEVANSKLVLSRQIAKAKELNSDSEQSLILIAETLQKSQESNAKLREKVAQLKNVSCRVQDQKIQELEETIESNSTPQTQQKIQEIQEIKSELENNSKSLEKLNEELIDNAIE